NYLDATLYVDHVATQGVATAEARPNDSVASVGHPSWRLSRGDDGVGGSGGAI
ncbi:hypothetical protein KI387_036342, partial [Taxus chinensis]